MKRWKKGVAAPPAAASSVGAVGCASEESLDTKSSDGAAEPQGPLSVLITDNGPEWVAAFQGVADGFTEETGIEVNLEAQASTDYDKIIDVRLQGGEDGPDVFVVRPQWVPDFSAEGYLAPLEDQDWFTALPEEAQNPPNTVQDGSHFAFPIARNPNYAVYNKDLFEQAGVEVPTTLSELKEASEKLLDAGITPIAMSAQDAWWQWFIIHHAAAQHVLYQDPDNGPKIMAGEETFAGTAGWTEALQIYSDLKPYYMPNPLGTSHDAAKAAFLQGKAAIFTAPWILPEVRQTDLNVGAMVFPTTEDPDTPAMWGDYPVLLGVNPQAGAEDAAKQFSEYLLSDGVYEDLIAGLKYFPVKEGVDVSSVDPLFAEVQTVIEGKDFYPSPTDTWSPGVADAMLAKITDLLADKATIADVLDAADQAAADAR